MSTRHNAMPCALRTWHAYASGVTRPDWSNQYPMYTPSMRMRATANTMPARVKGLWISVVHLLLTAVTRHHTAVAGGGGHLPWQGQQLQPSRQRRPRPGLARCRSCSPSRSTCPQRPKPATRKAHVRREGMEVCTYEMSSMCTGANKRDTLWLYCAQKGALSRCFPD